MKNEIWTERRKGSVDLHLHTSCSDGERTPEQVIQSAKEAGMSAIGLTDHNCFAISKPIQDEDLEVIPGAEFSAVYQTSKGNRIEIHIIGLFFHGVQESLAKIWKNVDKFAYIKAVIGRLNELGMDITFEELREKYPSAEHFGRTHVADLLIEKGYAKDRPDAMDRWIGNRAPYYMNPVDYICYFDVFDCVRTIERYGGLPVLAHPFHYSFSEEEIERMIEVFRKISDGPLGMEVYYGKYTSEQVQYLERLADKFGLLCSAGSDSHKPDHPFVSGDAKLVERMKDAVQKRRELCQS